MGLNRRIKRDGDKKAQQGSSSSRALIVIDKPIIAENMDTDNTSSENVTELLDNMLGVLQPVDLIDTLTIRLKDDLIKYRIIKENDDGKIIFLYPRAKIPRSLYAVAEIEEIRLAGVKHGWAMAQQDEMLYIYNGKYWVKVEENDIKRFLSEAAIKLGYYSPSDALTHGFADAVYKQFKISLYLPSPAIDGNTVLINLENGTYEITAQGVTLRRHQKEDFLTYCLTFSFNPEASAPLFMQYLNRVLPDKSSQLVLQEFIGYIFIRHLKLEKALILYGSGQNGKSVLFEIITALLGEVNVSTKSLGDLVDRDSGNDNRAKLKDKLVNYGSEISSRGMDVDMFKRLVSGEPVAAREKYKTSFDLKNNCKFIFNANKLPAEIEHTEAYFRRFIIIPFTVTISDSEKDPELHTKIINSELPGVLNWAIEGLHRLLEKKKFSDCEAANNTLSTYKKESNSVAMMIEEEGFVDGYSLEHEYHMPNKKLYPIYRNYCSESGMHPLSKVNFSKELKSLGFNTYRNGKERGFIIKQETEYVS